MNVKEKIALLIRHADRDAIPEGSFGNDVLLNEKGKEHAQAFGANLSATTIHKIFTSPVERCVQTAELIRTGYRQSIEIIETTALGAPGLHIDDEEVAGQFYLKHGFDELYKRFIEGKELPGMPNKEEVYHRATTFLRENSTEEGTTLFITHDMLIAFYQYSLNQKIYTKDNWVNYLTGITFKNDCYEG